MLRIDLYTAPETFGRQECWLEHKQPATYEKGTKQIGRYLEPGASLPECDPFLNSHSHATGTRHVHERD